MSKLPETMYCSQQIHIPPMFPYILRQYAKAAIKTQPLDLLRWSCHYFRALSLNAETPTKKRIEYPEPKNYMGLTPGFLKVLLQQVGNKPGINISYLKLFEKWDGICLKEPDLIKILLTGRFNCAKEIPWYKFIAVCAGYLSENLLQTMILICNTLTEEPDGGSAMIPVDVFLDLYKFLAMLDCSSTWFEVDTWFGPCVAKHMPQSRSTALFITSDHSSGFPIHQATWNTSTGSTIPPEFAQCGRSFIMTPEQYEAEIKATNQIKTPLSEDESEKEMKTSISQSAQLSEHNSADSHQSNDSSVPIPKISTTDYTQKEILKELYEQYVEHIAPQDDKSIIVRNEPHMHLNRFLQSILISPSLLTINMSMFIPADTASVMQTIYMAKKADVPQEEPKLIRYQIDEVKGIGPVVDKETMEYFIEYIKEVAKFQHGMIMPKNLTHFQCPPLENFDYIAEKKNENENE